MKKFAMFLGIIGSVVMAETKVLFETSMGSFVLKLDERAPITVKNFLAYVDSGHYVGTVMHRIIPGFVVQGGGYDLQYHLKSTLPPIALETSPELKNKKYTIAMARTSNPNSASSQFFINLADHPSLDAPHPDGYGYAVFGVVVEGSSVIDQMGLVPTHTFHGMENVPVEPVVIQRVTRVEA